VSKTIKSVLDSARVVSVVAEKSDDVDEGAAYWVTAKVGGLRVRLYASPRQTTSGVAGLEPCGSGLQDWCDWTLIAAFGERGAREIGSELIARAGALNR